MKRILFIVILFFFTQSPLSLSMAQTTGNTAYWTYIEKYKTLAQDQMYRYKIPASITLAQGLLESGAGRSELATQANNHFGIKVGTGWSGPYILKHDDKKNEKFRKYNSVAESYEDHSKFLQKPRYASLFNLSMNDYKGWAKGLKRCGYATSPTYAEKLITIIENFGLHQYDDYNKKYSRVARTLPPNVAENVGAGTTTTTTVVHTVPVVTKKTTTRRVKHPAASAGPDARERAEQAFFAKHPVYSCNKNYYIIVQPGDNLMIISMMTEVSQKKLLKYNELPKGYKPEAGDILYLQKKRTRADKSFRDIPHIVSEGESMYDIAQHYGMKLSTLYKLNKLDDNFCPRVGDMLIVY
ncbi:MAG: glucosaminidase domain-containing protein [Bacteroidaceae bacterium]|nr:glucosaminidase domain-containing protein [Bacteroidaceae bacterium]